MDRAQSWMILFKFGQRDHLEQLRNRGLLHMKPQRFFREMESDAARGDRFETTDRVFQPSELRSLRVKRKDSLSDTVITPDRMLGPVLISLDKAPCNIYCMFAITEPATPLVDERNFQFRGADSFVVILHTASFLDRMCSAAAARGFHYESGRVQYYDPINYSGETGPFRKPATLSYQNEFRFIVRPGSSSPINLEIGSLADITSEVLPLSDINQLIELC
jgi:hypothetical protein